MDSDQLNNKTSVYKGPVFHEAVQQEIMTLNGTSYELCTLYCIFGWKPASAKQEFLVQSNCWYLVKLGPRRQLFIFRYDMKQFSTSSAISQKENVDLVRCFK